MVRQAKANAPKAARHPTVKPVSLECVTISYLTPDDRKRAGTDAPILVGPGPAGEMFPASFESLVSFTGQLNDFVYAVSGVLAKERLEP